MSRIRQVYRSLESKERIAFWVVLLLACSSALYSLFLLPRVISNPDLLQKGSYGLLLIMAILSLISAGLIFLRHKVEGGIVFVTGFTLVMILFPFIVSDLGLFAAALVFVIGTYIGSLLFSEQTSGWLPFLNGLAVVVILVVDNHTIFFAQTLQRSPWIDPAFARISWAICAIILGVYLVFLLRKFPSFNLRSKIVIISLILTIVPMGTVGILSTRSSQNNLTASANLSLVTSASQVASRLDAFIVNNLDIVRTEAQLLDLINYLNLAPEQRAGSEEYKHVIDIFLALQRKSPVFINSYALLDSRGVDVADTETLEVGKDKSDRAYFIEAIRTGLPYVSDVSYSPTSNRPSIYFSSPVRNTRGEIIGVLRVRYNADILQQILYNQGQPGAAGTFSLVISDHNILLASTKNPLTTYKSIVPLDEQALQRLVAARLMPEGSLLQDSIIDIPALAAGLSGMDHSDIFTGEFGDEAQRNLRLLERAGAKRLANKPWTVVVGQAEEQLLAPVQVQTRYVLLLGILASALAILFALFISQLLAAPLVRLSGTASQLAQGDLSARAQVGSQDEIGALAQSFNSMAEQLSDLVNSLEQRVADRTRALATSAEVSRRLSTILNTSQLIKEVVDQVQRSFNYYHVQIYLFDENRQNLVMAGGSGDAGRVMFSRGHSIPRGKGLVGKAAETISPVLVKDVTQAPGWLPNPLLPNTRSELAVPIAVGVEVFGVLDVQQDLIDGLQPEDADLMQSIATQVAIALQNARSYERAHRQAEREALINAINERIQSTDTIESALQVAVREIGRALGAQNTVIRLGLDRKDDGENLPG